MGKVFLGGLRGGVSLFSKPIGPMKGVIPTPDIDQIFYSTLGTEGKIWSTPTFKILPDTRHSILKDQEKAGSSKLIFVEFFGHFSAWSSPVDDSRKRF